MKYLFLEYPKCSTCKKAKKWLEENNIIFEDRHIVEKNPTKEDLTEWIEKSGLPVSKFFNTSGVLYREMNLKERVKTAEKDELIDILSTNGMLVKRPLVIMDKFILVGFKEDEWRKKLLEDKKYKKNIEGGIIMDNIESVLNALKNSKEPMKSGEIAETTGIDKKEVDKAIKKLKSEEKISSPKRCYYSINE